MTTIEHLTESKIEAATDDVLAKVGGDHTRHCCWHAVMAVAENAALPDYDYDGDPCLVENALDLVDAACNCR
jgi:hypothetical protein